MAKHSSNGRTRFAEVRSAYDLAFARLSYEVRTLQSAANGSDPEIWEAIVANGRVRAAEREYRERRDDLADVIIRDYQPRIEWKRGPSPRSPEGSDGDTASPDCRKAQTARFSIVKELLALSACASSGAAGRFMTVQRSHAGAGGSAGSRCACAVR